MNSLSRLETRLRCRSVFISDVHLGFPGCSADYLLHFLDSMQCDTLYLVGDIIDFWYMKRRRYWPNSHSAVIRKLLELAAEGTRVVFIPGNHDEAVRPLAGISLGKIEIHQNIIHDTADGKQYLILHGDEFDSVVRCAPWLAWLGCLAYSGLLKLNHITNAVRRRFGRGYWSLAAFLKHKVKNAVQYISSFEDAVVHEASKQGVDGVICGHIHRAEIRQMGPLLYMNCGDWVESCTALLERMDGSMELVQWSDQPMSLKAQHENIQPGVPEGLAA